MQPLIEQGHEAGGIDCEVCRLTPGKPEALGLLGDVRWCGEQEAGLGAAGCAGCDGHIHKVGGHVRRLDAGQKEFPVGGPRDRHPVRMPLVGHPQGIHNH